MNSANESKQKKTAQVVRTRPAGPDHQVVTIEGGGGVGIVASLAATALGGRMPWANFHRKLSCTRPAPHTTWRKAPLRATSLVQQSRPSAPDFCCAARITTCPFAWDTLKASLRFRRGETGVRVSRTGDGQRMAPVCEWT